MAAPVLFLELNSGYRKAIHHSIAFDAVKLLINTLRSARRINNKISLNTTIALAACEVAPGQSLQVLLAGSQYREEWLFLKELKTRTPFSDGFEKHIADAELTEVKTVTNQTSLALTWASLLGTGTVSFHVQPEWQQPWVHANSVVLDENGELRSSTNAIRNASTHQHVKEHQEWLRNLGLDQHPDAGQFWADRELRFPGLRFLARVKNQIADLATSGAPYKQALSSLDLLNNDALAWSGTGEPVFSAKVAAGEHDQRRGLCNFEDEFAGSSQTFDRHSYFTGGTAGRIHFRLSPDEHKFVVAHVGFKL